MVDYAIPGESVELQRLIQAARENADLLDSELHTIREWLRTAGYERETLFALLLLHVLSEVEGSLCTELSAENLLRRLRDLVDEQQAASWTERILGDLERESFPLLFGANPEDDRPLILFSIRQCRYLYFQKLLRHELDFVRTFQTRFDAAPTIVPFADLAAITEEVLGKHPPRSHGQAHELDTEQRAALSLGLSRGLALISGGPGTGKTSLILTLLRCLVRAGVPAERIAVAAPTGQAARRLGDAIRQSLRILPAGDPSGDRALASIIPSTLHKLLEYLPFNDRCRRHAENSLDVDVVIVDEASMVGMVLIARLLDALPPGARLILLGDKDQLPSVDAGAVLAHLIPSELSCPQGEHELTVRPSLRDAIVLLRTNHRSDPKLRAVAEAINHQRTEIVDSLPRLELSDDPAGREAWHDAAREGGCCLLELVRKTPQEIRAILRHWAEETYLSSEYPRLVERCRVESADVEEKDQTPLRELFQHLERARLLTLVREGPWGCVQANQFLEQMLRPRLDRRGRSDLFAGAPVLVIRNDPLQQIYNGDLGVTVRFRGGGLRVVFQRQGEFLALAPEVLPPHELGFALTVHKSQGSEYDQVFVVLPPEGGQRLLTKELIYTAVTRAKKLAILCGTPETLRLAISRRCQREAGLLRHIWRSTAADASRL